VLDETTMKFGLLMESAQAHQKLAEAHLERLQAHTQDLDGVVREEIRRTLIEELREVTAESNRAVHALRGMKRAAGMRGLILSAAAATLSTAVPIAIARWVLPSPEQVDALRARRDQLAANVSRLEQQGGRIEWRRCGESGRLCVRVDRSSPVYGEKGDYYVVQGY
jgi:uncharacterized protein involved in exopolysaccharide biosynthesis